MSIVNVAKSLHRDLRQLPALLAAASVSLSALPALADENGVSFWLPGQYASFAAVAPEPGFSMPLVTYGYSGDASASRALSFGGDVRLGVDSRYLGQFLIPTYSPPDTEIWGGQAAFSLGILISESNVSVDATLGSVSGSGSETVTGFGDLYPTAQLFWNDGVHNWMAYITGALPVGDYEEGRLTNLGLGHAAIDFGGAYTYFNPDTGWEASATFGFTINFENPDTNYTSGNAVHLDWAVSKFMSEQWRLGLVGYAYRQIEDDSGAPDVLNGFRGQAYGIGPQIAYSGAINDRPVFVSLRGYEEFEVENRTEGTAAFLTISLPF